MTRFLYFTHRWVGVGLALLMLLWFSSGLIIAYSNSVLTTREQQLARAEVLNPQPGWLSLGEAIELSADERAGAGGKAKAMAAHLEERQELSSGDEHKVVDGQLVRVDDEPIWRLEEASGRRFAVSAVDGLIRSFSTERAQRIAGRWIAEDTPSDAQPFKVEYVDTFDSASTLRNYQAFKPFHRFAVDDGHGTELIVSAKTGEVLQNATRLERGLFYAGNWLHLFRPLDLFQAGDLRRNTLFWAGLFAFVAGVSGMIIGWLRWKPGFFGRPTYSKGRTQPYQEFWLRYHFWTGLIGGLFAVLWAFSGTLSTNPLHIFSEAALSEKELLDFHGADWPATVTARTPDISPLPAHNIVQLGWSHVGDEAQLLVYTSDGKRIARNPWLGKAGPFKKEPLLAAARRFAGDAEISSQELLQDYDSYYYQNRRQGPFERPLPVLRVDFADAAQSSLYIDPQDGRPIIKMDSSRRIYRWIYVALHHWDFGWFRRSFHWNLWITTWALFGMVLSLSSVILGWRRLRRTTRVKLPEPQPDAETAAKPVAAATFTPAALES